jgi:uncharacterized membrane protein YoaK (UPF0700 family)
MTTPLHDLDSALRSRNRLSWLLFAGAAGAVNATAFLACQRYVTHVTGTITRIGLDTGVWALMGEYLLVLLCFIAGAAASVFVVRRTRARWGFAAPLSATVALLVTVAALGAVGAFGPFAGEVESVGSFALLSMLSFAMGLQNATVASATGLALRTTHMTGPASDLGVHMANAFESSGRERSAALRLAVMRGGKLLAFIAGAALAVPLANTIGYFAFLAPALMVSVATVRSLTHQQGEKRDDDSRAYGGSCARSAS